MRELARDVLAGEEAWVVGGAVRDGLLGRPVLDLDIACREPARAARAYAGRSGGAPFLLSQRHGAWRVALGERRTVDFMPLAGTIEADLLARDFTINAIAEPLAGGETVDPSGGRRDLELRVLRAVSAAVFDADPLRLLRGVRLEDELGFRLEPATAELVREAAARVGEPAGERILDELRLLSSAGWRRLADLGLLRPLGGAADERLDAVDSPEFRLVVALGESLEQLPISNELQRYGRTLRRAEPPDGSARSIHRFRRATEPWSLDALAYVRCEQLASALLAARTADPGEPLVRGDELGLPPGPEIGALLELIAEERAVGAISTREEAIELARSRVPAVRSDR